MLSTDPYEEAAIIANLSKHGGHSWVALEKATPSITHIVVHPEVVYLSERLKLKLKSLKKKVKKSRLPFFHFFSSVQDATLFFLAKFFFLRLFFQKYSSASPRWCLRATYATSAGRGKKTPSLSAWLKSPTLLCACTRPRKWWRSTTSPW